MPKSRFFKLFRYTIATIDRIFAGIAAILTAAVFIPFGLLALEFSSSFQSKCRVLGPLENELNNNISALNCLYEQETMDKQYLISLLQKLSFQDIVKSFDARYRFNPATAVILMQAFQSVPSQFPDFIRNSKHPVLGRFFVLANTETQIDVIVNALFERSDAQDRFKAFAQALFKAMHNTNEGYNFETDGLYRYALEKIAWQTDEKFVVEALPLDLLQEQYAYIAENCKKLPTLQDAAQEFLPNQKS